MSYLRVASLCKRYGDVTAVDDVSLQVDRGALMALVGPSGCGKTTILSVIAGLTPPTTGTVSLDGVDITTVPPQRRDAIMVFQNYALFPHMTVAANVGYGLEMRKVAKADVAVRVQGALELVGLADTGGRYPKQLSGGQQQRVALARAIAPRPKILLLDEPLSNLDAQLRLEVRWEIRRIQQAVGITTILVTHDQSDALSIADTMAVVNAGRVMQVGSPHDVYDHPNSEFVARFVARANIIHGQVESYDDEYVTVRVGRTPVMAHREPQFTYRTGESVALSVRPSRMRVDGGPGMENQLNGTVKSAQRLGDSRHLIVAIEGDQQMLQVEESDTAEARSLPGSGDTVRVVWRALDTCALQGGR